MPSRYRLTLAAAIVLLLSGCASERLAATPPPGTHLGGNWTLDTSASEDIGQAVTHLQAQILKALHERAGSGSPDPLGGNMRQREQGAGQAPQGSDQVEQPPGGESMGASRAPGAELVQEFLSYVPGNDLHIVVAPGSVSVTSENAAQQYATGIQTAVQLGEANAEQLSGWKDQRFIIDTQPDFGPALRQSFQIAPNGELVLTVRLHDGQIDTTLTRRYRRTNQAPAALLPSSD